LEAGNVPPSLNFPQLDFVKPSSGFHPVTWERVNKEELLDVHFMAKKVQKEDQNLSKPFFSMFVYECFSKRTYQVSINIKNDKKWNQHCRPKHGEVVLET
jgi:hypothetical protein